MEGCCCAGGGDAGVSDPLTVTRFTMRFALQRGPSGEFCSFSKIKKTTQKTFVDKGGVDGTSAGNGHPGITISIIGQPFSPWEGVCVPGLS